MNNDNEEGSQEAGNDDSERQELSSPSVVISDPYAVLKVERDADDDTIQKSYKHLSRTFHPDKQPPGPAREAAQEVFISFKNAHDILTDPVQRQAFNDHGSHGVEVVRRSIHLHEKHPNALYSTLAKLHQSGQQEQARLVLKEALQHLEYELHNRSVRFSATMEFPCTTVSSQFLGEGDEPLTVPELQGGHVSFSVTSSRPTPDSKWSVTMGGSTNVMNGKGEAVGQFSLGYKPVQDTHVSVDMDLSDPCKLAVGTTRKLSNETIVTTKMSTMPKTNNLSLLVMSQRALFSNMYLGTCAFAMGTDFAVQFYQLSCMTLWSNWPQLSVKFKLGATHPFKISAQKKFGSGQHKHTGHASCAFSPSSVEIKGVVDHALSSYATWSIGIQHATLSGLTWLVAFRRGDVSFRIPINVSTIQSPGYSSKVLLLTFLSGLWHSAICEAVKDTTDTIADPVVSKTLNRESSLMELDKSKEDAEQQTQLMVKIAEASREIERSRNGLIIMRATYWIDGGGSMDATTQLQFWVKNSSLKLPPTPKSHLLGFYSLTAVTDHMEPTQSWWKPLTRYLSRQESVGERTVPMLTVRYEFSGRVCEMTVEDDEELVLPHPKALHIGESNVVR